MTNKAASAICGCQNHPDYGLQPLNPKPSFALSPTFTVCHPRLGSANPGGASMAVARYSMKCLLRD